MLLGCIADDLTGASDIALMLARGGMRTVQTVGVPQGALPYADAVVVSLKSRTAPVAEAVRDSLAALAALRAAGARRFFFKYCSTFDSTDRGNIGPVADALLDALGARFAIACPAFPVNKRTIYLGHLFVGDRLLSESGMQNHPLTPMTDPDLVRVLGRQTKHKVGLVPHAVVARGAAAIGAACAALERDGIRYAIVDALADDDLTAIGAAIADHALVTGGSGVALGLPEAWRKAGLLSPRADAQALPHAAGHVAAIAGSCSTATLGQIAEAAKTWPTLKLTPERLAGGEDSAAKALDWARSRLAAGPVLVYGSGTPEEVKRAQGLLGRERAGAIVEEALAEIAAGLAREGVGRLIVAGGETSGAVVTKLGVKSLRIGPEIAPGVPWLASADGPKLHLALKSGNFGGPDFFRRAVETCP